MKCAFATFLLLCIFIPTHAQDTVFLTQALKIDGGSHYGREAIYTDTIALQIYDTKTIPKAGCGGWKPVKADSLNQFHTEELSHGGYLYFSYSSPRTTTALLHVKGGSGIFFNAVPHAGDVYGNGWFYIPVIVKKGLNELYFRPAEESSASLIFSGKPVSLNIEDPTLPSIILQAKDTAMYGAVVVINQRDRNVRACRISATFAGNTIVSNVPGIPALSSRKIWFRINATGANQKGKLTCKLVLMENSGPLDEKKIQFDVIENGERFNTTFFSHIDSSLQYYAVTPQTPALKTGAALFLSVHGAGVEASGQAAAYEPKTWGTLVAATNRRPRGFNWEDWGRLDALEVLKLAKDRFQPDPSRIYLTGHSMGGHGTWILGATYPDHWAAIAACSGYASLKEYASHDGLIPDTALRAAQKILLRSSNASDIQKMLPNYKSIGIYILHGDSDEVVPVKYARQMRGLLGTFHTDMSYYEYLGGAHWFGNQSVDWNPIFEFFKWHRIAADSTVSHIDFTTANPGISSSYYWASVEQQIFPLEYSRIKLQRDFKTAIIAGTTENVLVLALSTTGFAPGSKIRIGLDGADSLNYTVLASPDTIYFKKTTNKWIVSAKPSSDEKNPKRYGTFKEAFDHHMLFVYGTTGNATEQEWAFNKAKFDAETWYYRGNGAVDIIADKDYRIENYKNRSVILYGNASTNSAWNILLSDCPIQVRRNEIQAGDKIFRGNDLGAYFIRPIHGSPETSVAVITGTGLKGMQAANANQYFAGGSGFPDYMIFKLQMLEAGAQGIVATGFFDNNWKLKTNE